MRPIGGAAPGISWADHFTAMRDNRALARPANPSEAVATGELDDYAPPSKARLKRIARHNAGLVCLPEPRAYPAPTAAALASRVHRETLKRDLAALGGTLTVRGDDEPRRAPLHPETGETELQRWRRQEAERLASIERAKAAAHAKKNARWREVATGQGELFK